MPCIAEPLSFLNASKTKERHGVRFRLVIEPAKSKYESYIDITIKPECSRSSDGERVSNGPYIVIYAVDKDRNVEGAITWEFLQNPSNSEQYGITFNSRLVYSRAPQTLNHRKIAKAFGFMKPTQ